jgi:hypothetical protein
MWRFGTTRYLWYTGLGVFGMILTKETYIIHIGCALIALPVAWLTHKIKAADALPRARQTWDYADLVGVLAVGFGAILFFYSGNFMNFNGLKGLYETFAAWFHTGSEGAGHEKPWWYWLMLIGRYEAPIAIGLLAAALCLWFRNMTLRYLAIYGVGTVMAYSIVAYKTPWCIISIVWPLLFVFGLAVVLWGGMYRRIAAPVAALAVAFSLGYSILLNYFRSTSFAEPYVYVQTYNDIWKLTDPLLTLARRNPTYYHTVGHLIRTSTYPLPWILGDFTRIGYYEKDNLPGEFDADFLLVQEDKIETVEAKLRGTYYTMPLTIRPYQDTSKLYLSSKVFGEFYRGRVPDFVGGAARP